MNATGFGTAARTVAIALILVVAAALGLVVGNALNSVGDRDATTNAGYPVGYQGGAAVPTSRTAAAVFSLDAMSALQATRGDSAGAPDYVDYAQRHAAAQQEADAPADDYVDYGQRHTIR